MKRLKIKTLIPFLIGLFIIIGGLTMLNMQQAEARGAGDCNYIPMAANCMPGHIGNCICFEVEYPPTY